MSYSHTKSRVLQWLGIILIIGVFVGAYWYFQVRASTLNQSQNELTSNGLVGLWSFNGDDISGTTAYDRSGSGNNGTLTNTPAKVTGVVGQALDFWPNSTDTNAYVTMGDPVSGALDFGSGDFSVSLWRKGSGYAAQGSGANIVLTKQNFASGSQTTGYSFYYLSTNLMSFSIGNGTTGYVVTEPTSTIADNEWHHYVGERSGSTIALYVDGTLVAQAAVAGSTSTTTSLTVGGDAGGQRNVKAVIDEVRIYNRALPDGEVVSLFAQGGGTKIDSSVSQAQGTGRLDSDLAGYWAMDDGSGTSATDSSTNGNTGTLTNGPTWGTGQISGAVAFDGVNDSISIPDSVALEGLHALTVSAWVRTNQNTADGTIISKNQGSASLWGLFQDDVGSVSSRTDTFSFIVGNGTTLSRVEGTTGIAAVGQWIHVVGVWQQSNESIKLYVNGALNQENTVLSGITMSSDTNAVTIGSNSSGSYFNGELDETRVYARALSADEVGQLYHLTAPTSVDTGLKGYWSFNGQDMNGTTVYNRSGARNNGVLTNGPTNVLGRLGQAVNFDGVDDYVSVADSTSLDIGDTVNLTLTGWLYRNTATTTDTIIAKRNGITAADVGYIAYLDATTDKLVFEVSDGTDEYALTSQTTFVAPGWYHYAIVWDQASAANSEIYIDGLANGATDTGTIANIGDLSNAVALIQGAESDAGNPFDGKLDEIRLYNRALSAAEIKAQYDAAAPDKGNSAASQPQGTGRLDSGLAGYWPLDDGSGTSATDSSTNGNVGTLTNGPTWTTGQIGGAVDFDGANDVITTARYVTGKGSISAWVNTTATINSGRTYALAGASAAGNAVGLSFNGYTSGGNKWEFSVRGGYGATINVTSTVYTSNTQQQGWHLLTVTWDTAAGASFYIDGILVSNSTTTTGTLLGTMVFGIGATSASFAGAIDEVRLYDRRLSADEVSQLYRLTTPTGVDTSLKGYWSFNGQDMNGTTTYDQSGSGNTGTLTNGPTRAIGKLGQGLSFDGTNDYIVSVANSPALAALTQGSFSFWIKPNASWFGGIFRSIASDGGGNGPFVQGFEISSDTYGGTQTIRFAADGSTGDMQTRCTTVIPLNTWTHVVIVWDGTLTPTNTKFYINGVLDTTTGIAWGSGSYVASNGNFVLGVLAGGNYLSGQLDEFRIYNRQLSAAEVAALYNSSR